MELGGLSTKLKLDEGMTSSSSSSEESGGDTDKVCNINMMCILLAGIYTQQLVEVTYKDIYTKFRRTLDEVCF